MRLRLGTRGSELALAQTGWVVAELERARPDLEIEIVQIKTSGDRIRDVPLAQVGGKGLFVKEIETALLAGDIDCAVHSMKDVPGEIPPGLVIAAVPLREDPRDVVITHEAGAELGKGMRIGTCSPRREALLRAMDLGVEIVPLRGNVGTRLAKVERGEIDATVLAAAGLRRLGIAPPQGRPLTVGEFLPAVGQGTLALESREDEVAEVLRSVEDRISRVAADAERGFLIGVGGNCVTPLAAHAEVAGERVTLDALIAHPSGQPVLRECDSASLADAGRLGAELAARLLGGGGRELLDSLVEPS